MRKTIKVLFLAADPFQTDAPLQLEKEMRAIRQAIRQGRARDTLEFVSHFGTRSRDLHRALLHHEPQIVHFAGHGGASGVIYLEGEHGRPRAVDKDALGRLFDILDGEVRAVILNACDTLPVVEVLRDVVDYAIGTNRPISDGSAITFSEGFYTALAFGKGIQQAFDFAVNQLQLDATGEAETPVLRARIGADDEPLLPPAAPSTAAPGEGRGFAMNIRQGFDTGDLHDANVDIVGVDGQVNGGTNYSVDQSSRVRSMTGGQLNLTGHRIAPPQE
jgi:hypothetical protein